MNLYFNLKLKQMEVYDFGSSTQGGFGENWLVEGVINVWDVLVDLIPIDVGFLILDISYAA